jgi:ABC-type transport system involved in multi-copper enzyme maturation permease subunit
MEVITPTSKEISNTDQTYTTEGLAEKLRKRAKNGEDGSHNIKTVLAIAGKQIAILRQYKFDVIYWIFMPLLWLVPFIWLGQSLLGDEESEVFRTYTGSGDYLGFLLIGSMLWATLDSALWGVGNTLRWEQQSGTLEYLWVSPVARTDLLTGQALGEAGWVLINVLGQFAILSLIFQMEYNNNRCISVFSSISNNVCRNVRIWFLVCFSHYDIQRTRSIN